MQLRQRSQLHLRSDPWPGNSVCCRVAKKETNKQTNKKNTSLFTNSDSYMVSLCSLEEFPVHNVRGNKEGITKPKWVLMTVQTTLASSGIFKIIQNDADVETDLD